MNSMVRCAGPCAGILLAGLLAAACADAPSQPVQPRTTARLEILSGNAQTGAPGEELPQALVVRALDSAGAPVSGQIINFRVRQGGGSVFAGANVTGTDGVAREYWTLGPKAGQAQSLEARAVDNVTGAKIVFGTFTATAVANTAGSIEQCCVMGSGRVGTTLMGDVIAWVQDDLGNPVPNLPVTWTVLVGNGRITSAAGVSASSHVVNTNAQGESRVRFTPGTIAGLNVLRAAAGGVQDLDSIVGTPAAPVRFAIDPASLTLPGVSATGTLVGRGYDRWDNRTPQITRWTALDPSFVTVLSPGSAGGATATVRGNAQGTGRVMGYITNGSLVYTDTVNVTVQ